MSFNFNRQTAITAVTYVFLLAGLITTTVLLCGCLPLAPGKTSIMKGFYALQFRSPDSPSVTYFMGNLAICADFKNSVACSPVMGRSAATISHDLHSPQITNEHTIQVALDLMKKVFFSMPAVASACLLIALVTASISNLGWHAKCLMTLSTCLSAFATIVLLADAFATNRALNGIVIAAQISEHMPHTFEAGISWQALQWASFVICMISTGLLMLPSFLNADKTIGARTTVFGRFGSKGEHHIV